ncbi:FtsK/SpoIIIE family DNA translocase [Leptospira sp. GIMC2001]|uniref:FtsK/SpoIIIE family DNA translocase n=1 Tax=Leptospira sp. GIMC2001 TaxID=1513297 RepID=UPI002349AACD|nr:DNA translocase FtsK 4TM domain-containing protein [Leptospira sp. GIMC2001]WCL48397.1 DNA translocase FtsK 4TM domain-containing protein [Leptospira sp. GIMC2001]
MSPKKEFIPYLFVFVGVFCLFSMLSFQEADDSGAINWFGKLGFYFSFACFYLLGKASYIIGIGLLGLGALLFKKKDLDILGKLLLLPLLILSVSLAFGFLSEPSEALGSGGGVLGAGIGLGLDFVIGATGKAILTAFLFAYSLFSILKDDSLETSKAWFGDIFSSLQNFIRSGEFRLQKKENKSPSDVHSDSEAGASSSEEKKVGYSLDDFLNRTQVQSNSKSMEMFEKFKNFFALESRNEEKSVLVHAMSGGSSGSQGSFASASKNSESSSWNSARNENKIYPKFKNTSLYEGFFEEERIFRFHDTPVTLKRKLSETPDSNYLGFTVLDYTTDRKKGSEQSFGTGDFSIRNYGTNHDSDYSNEDFEESNELSKFDSHEESETVSVEDSLGDEFESDYENQYSDENETVYSQEDSQDDEESQDSPELQSSEDSEDLLDSDELQDEEDLRANEKIAVNFPEAISQIANSKIQTEVSPTPKEPIESPKTFVNPVKLKKGGYYISPKLLGLAKPKIHPSESRAETDAVARKIEQIIADYGIQSKVVSMEKGPIISRYELTIPNGIKLAKITSLADELKLYMAVKSIRIVAPIPGKSTIGIEVPNQVRDDVHLTDILRDSSLAKSSGGLSICIGKDIAGRSMNIDLTKLPHLLVAGTTGSGKSVCLNSMITSLIFTRSPSELRFIMIDPKMVEMTLYEDIPHLLMPVITDPKKATKALAWAIQEMETRYQSVSSLKCRDFQSYNQKVEDWAHNKGYQKMPYIVIFIDELSDLMMVSGKDLEEQITRISQKSRAVGIHLVMATQRPSVDVITGLIKANCPARMAFQVAQRTDSRTILDANGAESLLGKGDFLYRSPTASDLVRVQAPFVSEEEIEKIVEESKRLGSPSYVEINLEDDYSESGDSFDEDEDLIQDAWRIISQEGKASGSLVQRHLRIGYNKAARVIEALEKRGIISPQIGTKPREILKSL